jgi:lysine 2,3-aminomutase
MDEFSDWKLQLKNAVLSGKALSGCLPLGALDIAEIDSVSGVYKMRISPYLSEMLGNDAIRKQFVPDAAELTHNALLDDDPLLERAHSPTPRLVHRYPDRAVIFASDFCFAYCRHCTRKNTVLNGGGRITEEEIAEIVDYLRKTPAIGDVLITGGDPLTLEDTVLESLICQIRTVPHVSTIRIGTRAVAAAPMRITEQLADMLKKYHPLWVHVQFNHPSEITEAARQACAILLSRGISLNNQSVLLKGVNDDAAVMRELLLKLIQIRVRPYYLYQCDQVRGTRHFMTDPHVGMDIISKLQGNIPGYAMPRFVIDVCGGGGKIVTEHSNILCEDAEKLTLKNSSGKLFAYKKPF